MNNPNIPVTIQVRFDFEATRIAIAPATGGEPFITLNVKPAGEKWCGALDRYLREERCLFVDRHTLNAAIYAVGALAVDGQAEQRHLLRGHNVDNNLPDACELTTRDVQPLLAALFAEHARHIGVHLHTFCTVHFPDADVSHVPQEDVPALLGTLGLTPQMVELRKGEFPPVRGIERWLTDVFQAPVRRVGTGMLG